MADSDTLLPEDLLKVATILWAVVALYHSKPKAEGCLGVKDGLSSQSLTKGCGEHGVRHAGMEVNDRVVIQSPTTMWIDVMNRVCLYELARHGDTRTTGIIWAKALLSCAVHYSGTRQCLGRSSGGTRTSAQRFSCARTARICFTVSSGSAVGLVCGREVKVGMRHVQKVSLCDTLTGRPGRLGLVNSMWSFAVSHFRFQRQIVLRCTPQRLATICRGSCSRISNCSAKALAFGG